MGAGRARRGISSERRSNDGSSIALQLCVAARIALHHIGTGIQWIPSKSARTRFPARSTDAWALSIATTASTRRFA